MFGPCLDSNAWGTLDVNITYVETGATDVKFRSELTSNVGDCS